MLKFHRKIYLWLLNHIYYTLRYIQDWKHITCAHSALCIQHVTVRVAPRGVKYRSVGRSRRMERAIRLAFYSAEVKSKVEKTVCIYLYVSCGRELGARLSASSKCCNSFSLPYVFSGLLPDMKGYFVYPLSLNRES